MKYPETRRVDQVDEYFGVKVPDPYRWLEADVRESPEVAEWVKKQNEIARKYLDAIPQRHAIEKRLTELWNYERYSPPVQKGGKYFYLKNDGLQNQPVLYVADSYKVRRPRAGRSEHVVERRHDRDVDRSAPAKMAACWRTPDPKPAAIGSKST